MGGLEADRHDEELHRLVAEVRREDAAAERRRHRWHAQLARDETSLASVLHDAATAGDVVRVTVDGAGELPVRVRAVSADHVELELPSGRLGLVPLAAIEQVATTGRPPSPDPQDGSPSVRSTGSLVSALEALAPVEVEVGVRSGGRRRGRLEGVGEDVLIVGDGRVRRAVAVGAVAIVAVTGLG